MVLAVTLVAAFVRLYRLGSLPPQAWVDEVWIALRARDLLRTGEFHVFYKTWWGGMHPLMVVGTAAAGWLGLSGSLVAARAISAAAGVLSVPLAFACFDEVLRPLGWPASRRRLAALLAAAILATLLSYLVVGRVGYEPVIPVAATLLMVWQFQRALRLTETYPHRRAAWSAWLLAGLALGASQYISQHARFILPLFGWLALHHLLLAPPVRRRALALRLAGLAGVAAVVALPLAAFFWREPAWFLGRARAITASVGPAAWLENARLILLSFSLRGDADARHNLPGQPLFDLIQSTGLWVGLGWALVHARRLAPARDLLVWAAIMLLPSLLTDSAPQFERMVGFVAPAAALTAIGWLVLWEALRARLPNARWLRLVGAGLVAASLAWNAWAYFGPYAAHPALGAAFTTTPVRLAQTLAEQARHAPVFVERLLEAEDVFAFDFLLPVSEVRRLDFRQCLPLTDRRAEPTTYLVLSDRDTVTVERLTALYPAATVTPIEPEPAALMGAATLVEVPAGASLPPVARPADARFDSGLVLLGYEWSGARVHRGETLFLTLYWKAEAPVSVDWTAFAHVGTGLDGGAIVAQHDGAPCQGFYPTSAWGTGDVVADSFAMTIPEAAAPGEYPLAVGWYQYPSLERLAVLAAAQALPDNRVVIGTVQVD
jgi:hypothetical protein